MYPILEKQILSPTVKLIVVQAPLVAGKAKAGQFVIVRMDEYGERIPLTIADFNSTAGTITLIFQEVGKSTMQMGTLEVGDEFLECGRPVGTSYGNKELRHGGNGWRRRGYCAFVPAYARLETGWESSHLNYWCPKSILTILGRAYAR